MKNILMLLMLTGLLLGGCVKGEDATETNDTGETTQTEVDQATTDTPEPEGEPMSITLEIQGMHCVNCKAKVEKILKEIPGVIEAEADNVNHVATVMMAPGAKFDAALAKDKLDVEMFTLVTADIE